MGYKWEMDVAPCYIIKKHMIRYHKRFSQNEFHKIHKKQIFYRNGKNEGIKTTLRKQLHAK